MTFGGLRMGFYIRKEERHFSFRKRCYGICIQIMHMYAIAAFALVIIVNIGIAVNANAICSEFNSSENSLWKPSCENGQYKATQCNFLGGCWCVDAMGNKIEGSERLLLMENPLSCEDVRMQNANTIITACQHEKTNGIDDAKNGIVGQFIPSCEEDGSYSKKQCHEGHCWCVNEDGKKLDNVSCFENDCSSVREKVLNKGLLGAHAPSCEEDGSYSKQQCHSSTGYCWCVNENGKELDGSRVGIGKNISCVEDDCSSVREKVLKEGLLGAHAPSCEEDGSYSKKQCHEGHCWCVNEDGKKLDNVSCFENDCSSVREKVLNKGLLGAHAPSCEEDGSYSKQQCHSSTGYCWCVNENGKELDGSRVGIGKNISCVEDDCSSVREKVLKEGLLGAHAPSCEEDGSYSKQQCHSSTGYCWCVNKNGEELDGSRVRSGGALVCPEDDCSSVREHVLKKGFRDAYVPNCEEDGSYSEQQCHNGHCWCTDENGKERDGSRVAGDKVKCRNDRHKLALPLVILCLSAAVAVVVIAIKKLRPVTPKAHSNDLEHLIVSTDS